MIVPSIDIRRGKVVQLRHGRDLVLTDPRHPVDLARYFARFGPVAVVDLDATLGTGSNARLIAECCRAAPCRVSGGIRTESDVRGWIRQGAEKVIIGTAAAPAFLRRFPREWLIAAIDARDGYVVVEGWRKSTATPVREAAEAFAPYCSELLYTCVEREGTLDGGAVETAIDLRRGLPVPLTVAGGIVSIDEITRLINAGCSVQLGCAIYQNRVNLAEAWVAQVRYGADGLVPTVVQDEGSGDVRMLAFSSAESLRTALETGQGWYYARSRGKLWRKGETSGHTQKLIAARWDCDRDAVLFRIVQSGPSCHTGQHNCFGTVPRDVLSRLASTLSERMSGTRRTGYTRRLLSDRALLHAKLREELEEVIRADGANDVAWEAADVLYHLLVRALGEGVTLSRICQELRSRMK